MTARSLERAAAEPRMVAERRAGRAEYVRRARGLVEGMLQQARELPDGSLTWGRGAGRDRLPVADSGPFNGRCGEALLLAAAYRVTGEQVFAEAASRVLLTLDRRLGQAAYRDELADTVENGLCGLAGILYAMVRVGDLLDRPEPMASARHLVGLFDEGAASDERFDVIWGAAGVILGLLALAERGCAQALSTAEQWAEHLLARRQADPVSGLRGWLTIRATPSSGFAHGASGIAHALLRLFRHSRNPAYYDAAFESFALERHLYVEEAGNWASESQEGRLLNMISWCHGGAGIALARLSALELVRQEDETDLAHDLRLALRATASAQVPAVDTLCCGYFGRIDVLLEAGRRLGNASLERQAHQLARSRLERADREGFKMPPAEDLEPHLVPGLWQGPGGVAYALLRLAEPDACPCVLAMA